MSLARDKVKHLKRVYRLDHITESYGISNFVALQWADHVNLRRRLKTRFLRFNFLKVVFAEYYRKSLLRRCPFILLQNLEGVSFAHRHQR
jgi:hypothetical protein